MNRHAALVRNDLGGLEVRGFASGADAARVAIDRELPSQEAVAAVMGWKGRRSLRHTDFARELGISPRIVRAQWARGGLPGTVQHSAYILLVPAHLLRLARSFGLKQVERMASAGMIPAETVRQ